MTLSAYLEDGLLVIVRDGEPTRYHLKRLKPDEGVAYIAWRLTREDGQGEYDVAVLDGFPSCSCGDACWHRERLGETCKHFAACQMVGLIP